MDDRIYVGIVELGLAATAHIRGYLSRPAAQVLAVCDTDGRRAADFGEKYGIERVYASFADLLDDRDVQVIDIATPTFFARGDDAAGRAGGQTCPLREALLPKFG